jgi:hypothetical protein
MSGVDEEATSLSTPPEANEQTTSNDPPATQSHPEISRQNEQGTSTQAEPYIQMAESESQRNDGLVVTSTSPTIPDAWQQKSLLSFGRLKYNENEQLLANYSPYRRRGHSWIRQFAHAGKAHGTDW